MNESGGERETKSLFILGKLSLLLSPLFFIHFLKTCVQQKCNIIQFSKLENFDNEHMSVQVVYIISFFKEMKYEE